MRKTKFHYISWIVRELSLNSVINIYVNQSLESTVNTACDFDDKFKVTMKIMDWTEIILFLVSKREKGRLKVVDSGKREINWLLMF